MTGTPAPSTGPATGNGTSNGGGAPRPQGPHPLAIGGIGGSGTRIFARFLSELGYFIGGDLNGPLDNLWFTLLFKRRDILLEDADSFAELARLFFLRMTGIAPATEADVERISALAAHERLQYRQSWLAERARSFLTPPAMHVLLQAEEGGEAPDRGPTPWGWKEPNTQVVIDRLLALNPELRYVHVIRHGLDMAFSKNLHQLQLWGPVFLGRPVRPGPVDALAYWCAVHKRIDRLKERFPGRILEVKHEDLCTDPLVHMRKIADFAGADAADTLLHDVAQDVRPPQDRERFRNRSALPFAAADLEFVASRGYRID